MGCIEIVKGETSIAEIREDTIRYAPIHIIRNGHLYSVEIEEKRQRFDEILNLTTKFTVSGNGKFGIKIGDKIYEIEGKKEIVIQRFEKADVGNKKIEKIELLFLTAPEIAFFFSSSFHYFLLGIGIGIISLTIIFLLRYFFDISFSIYTERKKRIITLLVGVFILFLVTFRFKINNAFAFFYYLMHTEILASLILFAFSIVVFLYPLIPKPLFQLEEREELLLLRDHIEEKLKTLEKMHVYIEDIKTHYENLLKKEEKNPRIYAEILKTLEKIERESKEACIKYLKIMNMKAGEEINLDSLKVPFRFKRYLAYEFIKQHPEYILQGVTLRKGSRKIDESKLIKAIERGLIISYMEIENISVVSFYSPYHITLFKNLFYYLALFFRYVFGKKEREVRLLGKKYAIIFFFFGNRTYVFLTELSKIDKVKDFLFSEGEI